MAGPGVTPFGTGVQRFGDRGARFLRLDFVLLLATLGLIVFSLVTLGSATSDNYFVTHQAGYASVGLALMFVLAFFDYSRLRELKWGLYGTMIGLILLVLVAGTATRGSRRRIDLPFFGFQPSEFGKILLVLALSAFAIEFMRRRSEREITARVILLAIIPAMLVMAQPDLGTSIVYVAIGLAVLFIIGVSWRQFAGLAAIVGVAAMLALVVAPAIGLPVLKGYQQDRLTAFLHKDDVDPRSQGYQLNQSVTAIGSGQKTGRGPEGATQTQLDFLPESHTDFIFAVVGEQYGFVGAGLVLTLYALLIWRALRILTISKNLFGAIVAGAITAMLMTQVFVNAGGNVGIMPITGIPLPLLSYGGSSVIVTLIALGLLQSIYVQARETAASKREVLA
ncbi:MAG: rod shape-determining protein RodA [Solirubrobacterales bacterium]